MAKKLMFIPINGSDTIAESINTINQNFGLVENIFDDVATQTIDNFSIEDITWNQGTDKGPSATIKMSNGKTTKILNIPVASDINSGVINTIRQELKGVKVFNDGIQTNFLTDTKNHNIITSDGNKVYIGGEHGIVLEFGNDVLMGVKLPANCTKVDLSKVEKAIENQKNSLSEVITKQKEDIAKIVDEYKSKVNDEAERIDKISENLAKANQAITDLSLQTDGKIENYYGKISERNTMAKTWGSEHDGDTFTVTDETDSINYRKCFVYKYSAGKGSWIELDENEYPAVVGALLSAMDAKSTADGKVTTFLNTPVAPYRYGDIWIKDGGMLFCIRTNLKTFAQSDWDSSLIKYVDESSLAELNETIGKVSDALDKVESELYYINNDDTFSIFEKREFLNNTWYAIVGTNGTYDSTDTTRTDSSYFGTTSSGTFYQVTGNCEDATLNNTLKSKLEILYSYCKDTLGLFKTELENTKNFNRATLYSKVYDYCAAEEACKQKSYIKSLGNVVNELTNQVLDNMVQTWFGDGLPAFPWGDSDADTNEKHIGDIYTDTQSCTKDNPNGGRTYKFMKNPENANTKSGDVKFTDDTINYYWKVIKNNDVLNVLSQIDGLNTELAKLDGGINVFTGSDTSNIKNYAYGDVWFCVADVTIGDDTFLKDEIYYCSNTSFDGSVNGEGKKNVRETFNASDWTPTTKTSDFILKFTNMASDKVLTPIEKQQLVNTWREITGITFDSTKNIPTNITGGSFRRVYDDLTSLITSIEGKINDSATKATYKTTLGEEKSAFNELKGEIVKKLSDVQKILSICGCSSSDIANDTDLTTIVVSGLNYNQNYLGTHSETSAQMLADIFATYYNEEDNIKIKIQNFNLSDAVNTVNEEMSAINSEVTTAKESASSAQAALDAINSDNVFSVFEKKTFLHDTLYPICGSSFNYSKMNNSDVANLATSEDGSFYQIVNGKTIKGNTNLINLIDKFKSLMNYCNGLGLFASELTNTTGFDRSALYTSLYSYYNKEEICKQDKYISSVGTLLTNLEGQLWDNMVQSWYGAGNPPTTATNFPWRNSGDDSSVDEKHIGDTFTNTNPYSSSDTNGGRIYKFVKKSDTDTVTSNDFECSPYVWKLIKSNEVSTVMEMISSYNDDYDAKLATMDGGVNVFNGDYTAVTATDGYAYGDIWFCTEDYTVGFKKFYKGDVYYCNDTAYDGKLNDEGTSRKTCKVFNADAWVCGTRQQDFVTGFANLASDKILTPSEKIRILDEWYKIAGISLPQTFSVENNILSEKQIGDSSINNGGSFYALLKVFGPVKDDIKDENGTKIGSSLYTSISTKLAEIVSVLNTFECYTTHKDKTTDLSTKTISGLITVQDQNGASNPSLLSSMFAAYYNEEANIRQLVNDHNLSVSEKTLQVSIDNAQRVADAVSTKMSNIDSDTVFTVFEKKEFLSKVWKSIVGFDSTSTSSTLNTSATEGLNYVDSSGVVKEGYYGTKANGTYWNAIRGHNKSEIGDINSALLALYHTCDTYGLFGESLKTDTTDFSRDALYTKVYDYYDKEETLRQTTYNNSISSVKSELIQQLRDGKLQSWYGSGLPPTSDGENRPPYPWSSTDNESDHEGDTWTDTGSSFTTSGSEYSPTAGKVWQYTAKSKITMDTTKGDVDCYTNCAYYWKLVQSSDIQNILNSIQTLDTKLATVDNTVNVYHDKPALGYSYGDIWFCSDDSEEENGFFKNNVYYCSNTALDGRLKEDGETYNVSTEFKSTDWTIVTDVNTVISQMDAITEDGILSTLEKQDMLQRFYEIAGVVNLTNYKYSDSLTNDNNGSFNSVIGTFVALSDDNTIQSEQLDELKNLVDDLATLLRHLDTATKDNTSLSDKPINKDMFYAERNKSFNPSGNVLTRGTSATESSEPVSLTNVNILSTFFNNYYLEEENVKSITNTQKIENSNGATSDIVTQLASEDGGLTLTSLIKLKYQENVTGGLDGIKSVTIEGNTYPNNVGLWLGGSHQDAIDTLNGRASVDKKVPVILTKTGTGSRIGPFKVGSTSNIYIGSAESNPVTVIGDDYISLGATYTNSSNKTTAKDNAAVYLDRSGIGSKIGPLNIGSNSGLYIGDKTSGDVTVIDTDYISMGTTYAKSFGDKDKAKTNASVYLDRSGIGSKIGPFSVGSSSSVYIGDKTKNNVTIIDKDYISMGTTYAKSSSKANAKDNAAVYLDRDGVGSKIGPFNVDNSDTVHIGDSETIIESGSKVIEYDYIYEGFTFDAFGKKNEIKFRDAYDAEGFNLYMSGTASENPECFSSYLTHNELSFPDICEDDNCLYDQCFGGDLLGTINDLYAEGFVVLDVDKETKEDFKNNMEERYSPMFDCFGEITLYDIHEQLLTSDTDIEFDRPYTVFSFVLARIDQEGEGEEKKWVFVDRPEFKIVFVNCTFESDNNARFDIVSVDYDSQSNYVYKGSISQELTREVITTETTTEYNEVAVISKDYISLGAKLSDSSTPSTARTNATIYLNKKGVGSKIGPLNVGGDDNIYIGTKSDTDSVTIINDDYISLGATYNDSKNKDLALANAHIVLDKSGESSKIGCLNISGENQVYIGNKNSTYENVTVIDKDYISMGATYSNSSDKTNAKENAVIYLDKNGYGSKVGPLVVRSGGDNSVVTFGESTPTYQYTQNLLSPDYSIQIFTDTVFIEGVSVNVGDNSYSAKTSTTSPDVGNNGDLVVSYITESGKGEVSYNNMTVGYKNTKLTTKPYNKMDISNVVVDSKGHIVSIDKTIHTIVDPLPNFNLVPINGKYVYENIVFPIGDDKGSVYVINNDNVGVNIPHYNKTNKFTPLLSIGGNSVTISNISEFLFIKPVFLRSGSAGNYTWNVYIPRYKYENESIVFEKKPLGQLPNGFIEQPVSDFVIANQKIEDLKFSKIGIGKNGISISDGFRYTIDDYRNATFNIGNILSDKTKYIYKKPFGSTNPVDVELDDTSFDKGTVISGVDFGEQISNTFVDIFKYLNTLTTRINNLSSAVKGFDNIHNVDSGVPTDTLSVDVIKTNIENVMDKINTYGILLVKK